VAQGAGPVHHTQKRNGAVTSGRERELGHGGRREGLWSQLGLREKNGARPRRKGREAGL